MRMYKICTKKKKKKENCIRKNLLHIDTFPLAVSQSIAKYANNPNLKCTVAVKLYNDPFNSRCS